MSGLHIIAEALARVEFKIDAILNHLKVPFHQPMEFSDNRCPVCRDVVKYTVDVLNQVVSRRCGCRTGKVPSMIPLMPVPQLQGASHGQVPAAPEVSGADREVPSNGSRGKAR